MWDEVPEEKWFTQDDIDVQLVCIMHDKSNKGSNDGSDSSDYSSTDGQDDSGNEDEENFAPKSARLGFVSLFMGLAATAVMNMI